MPDMTLIGQVETGYLQDGEEQGYAQAFCQRGEGHDDHGGEQLPARNLDQAGDILQEGSFGGRQLAEGDRWPWGADSLRGTGMVQTIAEAGWAGDCQHGTRVVVALSLQVALCLTKRPMCIQRVPHKSGSGEG